MGVANERSIAWGIAKACHDHGAELAFTFQGDALEKRVRPLANSIGAKIIVPCDVTQRGQHRCHFCRGREEVGRARFPGPRHRLFEQGRARGRYLDTSADNFQLTMNVELLLVHRGGAARCAADEERRQPAHAYLLRRRAGDAALQRHGRGQGRARGERALSGGRPRRAEDPGQRHLRRADQDAGLRRDRRLPLYPEVERAQLAPRTQRHGRGGRQCRSLPAVGPRHRRDR